MSGWGYRYTVTCCGKYMERVDCSLGVCVERELVCGEGVRANGGL